MVSCLSTNWVRVTSLMCTVLLPLSHTANQRMLHTHFMALFLDYLEEIFFYSSGLYGAREYNRCRHTDHLAGRHSIRTNQRPTIIPPFLCQTPFLVQPSHFILAWERHQICGFVYPMVWRMLRLWLNLSLQHCHVVVVVVMCSWAVSHQPLNRKW